jgi:hypothetical protein
MLRTLVTAAAVCLASFASLVSPVSSGAQEGDAVVSLAGRWAGQGVLIPVSGPAAGFKCVITYFPSSDGTRVRQNLRCRGDNHMFDAATHLEINGAQVTGRWVDNVYSLTGTVSGVITKDGFDVLLTGKFFEAKMTVSSSGCQQSVRVVPESGGQMRELAAVLKKC